MEKRYKLARRVDTPEQSLECSTAQQSAVGRASPRRHLASSGGGAETQWLRLLPARGTCSSAGGLSCTGLEIMRSVHVFK